MVRWKSVRELKLVSPLSTMDAMTKIEQVTMRWPNPWFTKIGPHIPMRAQRIFFIKNVGRLHYLVMYKSRILQKNQIFHIKHLQRHPHLGFISDKLCKVKRYIED